MKKIKLNGKRGKGNFTLVDNDMFDLLNQFNWNVDSKGYVARSVCLGKIGDNKWRYKIIKMHRFINNSPVKMETDHVNGNRLDNQRHNLRTATNVENQRNRKVQKNSSSGFKGVTFDKYTRCKGKWRARIDIGYKRIHLGNFVNKAEAALAYNQAAIKYFGEFARLNKI